MRADLVIGLADHMNLLLRGAQGLLNAAWRATHRSEKAIPSGAYPAVAGSGGWVNLVREPFTGAWQRNVQVDTNTVLTYSTVFSCISLIASDISKLRIRLVSQDGNGIWTEVEANSPFWPVLRKQNRYQTRIQFFANWIESKLIHGNTYALKERDARGVVSRLYILDPSRVTVLCAPDGSVFYELRMDHLTGITAANVTVPAAEIIHDRWNTFFHPLIGTSPITAAGLAATQGLKIQENQTQLFANGAQPGGILIAPTHIDEEKAIKLQRQWNEAYGPGGHSQGRTAVLGDNMKYERLTMSSVDAQMIDQLKWSAETVVSVFHVPAYKVGVAPAPTYNNIEALNQAYYSDCLQVLLEAIELLLDEGLDLPKPLGTEFDLDGLLRMDTSTKVRAAKEAIDSGGMSPDEARKRYFDLGPVDGGSSPYMQQQNFSLAALAKRDRDDPFSKPAAPSTAPVAETPDDGPSADDTAGDDGAAARALAEELRDWEREARATLAA